MNEIPADVSRLDLSTVLEAVPNGVSIVDADGRIVYSNPAADDILGTPANGDPPERWADHYGVQCPKSGQPFPVGEYPLVRALAGEAVHDLEMVVTNPSLSVPVMISASSCPLKALDGTITGAVVVFRDVTKLRQAQTDIERSHIRLMESQRLKDELTAFVVHDLKNPLTTIMTLADLVLEGELDPATTRADLLDIQAAAARMHRMALDLLDLHLAEDGSLALVPERFTVGALLEEVRQALRRRAPGIHVDVRNPGCSLSADRRLLARVLMNLVDNCVKYGPEGGRISLGARVADGARAVDGAGADDGACAADGARILITVEDEGPGIPVELREQVFEKYARVPRDEEQGSTDSRGLGLRFCKVIVEAHGGRIWVEDRDSDAGARFCVELPAGS